MEHTAIDFEDLDCLSVLSHEETIRDDSFSDSTLPSQNVQDLLDETAYEPGTIEYRRARKRRQNRESATRTRMIKRSETEDLRCKIDELVRENANLMRENKALKSQNLKIRQSRGEVVPMKRSRLVGPTSLILTTLLVVCVCWNGAEHTVASEGRHVLTVGEEQVQGWGVWVGAVVMGVVLIGVLLGCRERESMKKELV
jgi:hypothetical protein